MVAFSEERTDESARDHDSLPSPVSIKRRSWPEPIMYVFVPEIGHSCGFYVICVTGSTLESELCDIISKCG